ncbi:MBL fold metallo-hydrolase [Rhodococcus sp. MEB064]|uniref:MBL fold metallo-hydrolase n=1 Tax=Rhodococcus sp. MEB064 TaxID=1587522 RepID=UPI0005ABFB8E|nr:MBL fold metallo-hydrolase [Rhodococcus sp. MEB064]KIQ18448.1 hypothetical protein RU01_07715 [Rhodococcus sp. MEB064]
MTRTRTQSISVTLVGGPTAVIDYAGLRFVTDPTFDPPSSYGPEKHGVEGIVMVKNAGPAVQLDELGRVDVVLASHEHWDNLDESGREFAAGVPHVFGPDVVAAAVPNTTVLQEWESREVSRPDTSTVTITAVPAHHGPGPLREALGPVLGFVLTSPGERTLYFSGDNCSVEVVREVAGEFPDIAVAVVNAGGPKFEAFGGEYIALSDDTVVEVADVLADAIVIPVHADSWEHFTQTTVSAKNAADAHGVGDRVLAMSPGETVTV